MSFRNSCTGRGALKRLLAVALAVAAGAAAADHGDRDRDHERERDRECPNGREITLVNGRIHTMDAPQPRRLDGDDPQRQVRRGRPRQRRLRPQPAASR